MRSSDPAADYDAETDKSDARDEQLAEIQAMVPWTEADYVEAMQEADMVDVFEAVMNGAHPVGSDRWVNQVLQAHSRTTKFLVADAIEIKNARVEKKFSMGHYDG